MAAASGGGGGGSYHGPTCTQAEQAVAFAYGQLGCPYVFGATGPCPDGFDCSGLTMSAWASAGVSIPRTSYGQATLPAVSSSALQPGDILEFAGDSHVGIYVGGGMLIDAPQPGMDRGEGEPELVLVLGELRRCGPSVDVSSAPAPADGLPSSYVQAGRPAA